MRETFDAWNFVIAAYAIGIGATLILAAHSWWGMRRAEKRSNTVRGR